MHEERLRILKVMNEATGRLDFNEFANMVGLPPSEVMAVMRELAKTGHLRKVGGGYGLTEIGKATLRSLVPVPPGNEFKFYFRIDKPAGYSAATPIEFYEIIQKIDPVSLEFHISRKDFENWSRGVLANSGLVEQIANVSERTLLGEALRSAISEAFESAYNLP